MHLCFTIYVDVQLINFLSSLVAQPGSLTQFWFLINTNPAEFVTQMENAGRLFADKYGYLGMIQLVSSVSGPALRKRSDDVCL